MKVKEINELIKFINQTDAAKEVAVQIDKFFNLSKIKLYLAPEESNNKVPVKGYFRIDDGFADCTVLINHSKIILKLYKGSLEKFVRNENYTIVEKKAQLLYSSTLFEQAKNRHDYSNRFAFTTQDIFFISGKKGEEKRIDYEDLLLLDEETNLIREYFTIRIELYQALLSISNLHIQQIDLHLFNQAPFKLKKGKGTRLGWELALALTQNNDYIELNDSQKPLFEKSLFDFLGLPYKNRGKEIGNYFRKGKVNVKELVTLKSTLLNIGKEDLIKSSKKK